MAINADALIRRRPSDKALMLTVGVGFPLLVLIGYARTYYLSSFFDHKALANSLVHFHAALMSLWVVFFTAQVALIRTKNVRVHMTMGWVGVALAAIIVVVGMWTAVDSHFVRFGAPPGVHPHSFFMVPLMSMFLFVVYFAGAIYLRKRPTEHKALMLLTAYDFAGAAIARIPLLPPEMSMLQYYGIPDIFALATLAWLTWKHKKFNWTVAAGVALFIISQPVTVYVGFSQWWLDLTAWIANANGWPS